MWLNSTILFFVTIISGLLVFFIPKVSIANFRTLLSFSGSYLFAICLIHLLPEIFIDSSNPLFSGTFILIGFFMQILIEFFSKGIEHGHIHHSVNHSHVHSHGNSISFMLVFSLCMHAFLEGSLLEHPSSMHNEPDSNNLLIGMIFHKIPEAFALASVLKLRLGTLKKASLLLILFSLASPFGIHLSHLVYQFTTTGEQTFQILIAIVTGNFLHIATTIFFENSPDHKFKPSRLISAIAGASMAIIIEMLK